jgi:exosortase
MNGAKMKDPNLSPFTLSRSSLVLGSKVAIFIALPLIIFYQDLAIVANDALQSEFMSYIIAIPFIFSYLIYRKRKMIRAAITVEFSPSHGKVFLYKEIAGTLLFLLAFLIYSYGSYTFTPLEYHMFALPIFVTACTLIIFNTQTLRQLAFPITFLFFLTPPPLQILYQAGAALSAFSSQAAYNILKTLALPVSLTAQYGNPAIILQKAGSQPLTFAVDIACSGVYSLLGFIIFATFLAYIARISLWKKAMIFLTGFPLIYALNILRIITIVLIGNYGGMNLATQIFHLLGGWFLIFIGTLLLLVISEKIFKIRFFTTKSKLPPCNYCNQNLKNKQPFCSACGKFLNPPKLNFSKRDLSKIVILIISAILIINLQVPLFALTQGPAEVTIQTLGGEQTLTQILPEIQAYKTQFIYRDREFEELSQQDASLAYAYIPNNKSETTMWVTIEIAKTQSLLHSWEACLITYTSQPAIQLDQRDIQLLQDPPLTARYFAFQEIESNVTQVVLYWYETAIFRTGSSQEQKHVKISLVAYTDKSENINSVEKQLLPFAMAIANYWQPIKTGSQISLFFLKNGITLIAITLATLAVTLLYRIIKDRKEKESNLKLYDKLVLYEEKFILQAVKRASKKGKATTNDIALHYQKLTGKAIELGMLVEKLKEAEKVGLIKREIASQEDEPILTWKSHVSI